jgi:hypothetical protein
MPALWMDLSARSVWYTKYLKDVSYVRGAQEVDTYLAVIIGEVLSTDNTVQIRLHKLLDNYREG